MSSPSGKRRPRPLTSTSTDAPESAEARIAKKASVSTGRGETKSSLPRRTREVYSSKKTEEVKRQWQADDIEEGPNPSSHLGLTPPTTEAVDSDTVDAKSRSWLAKCLMLLFGATLIIATLAIIVASFTGTPTDSLIAYMKWLVPILSAPLMFMLGYYFGSQRNRHHPPGN